MCPLPLPIAHAPPRLPPPRDLQSLHHSLLFMPAGAHARRLRGRRPAMRQCEAIASGLFNPLPHAAAVRACCAPRAPRRHFGLPSAICWLYDLACKVKRRGAAAAAAAAVCLRAAVQRRSRATSALQRRPATPRRPHFDSTVYRVRLPALWCRGSGSCHALTHRPSSPPMPVICPPTRPRSCYAPPPLRVIASIGHAQAPYTPHTSPHACSAAGGSAAEPRGTEGL